MKCLNSCAISTLLNLLILIAVVPILGIIIYSTIEQRHHLQEDAEREVHVISRSMAEVVTGISESIKQTLTTLASIEAFQEADTAACSELLRSVVRDNPRILNMALTDITGTVIASSQVFGIVSLADRKHVQQALATAQFAAGEYIIPRIGDPSASFSYACPVRGRDGAINGVLTAILELETISGFLDFSSLPEGSFMAITDHRGIRILYYPASETNPIGQPIRAASWDIARHSRQAQTFKQSGSDGMARIFAVEPLRLAPGEPPYMYAWAGIPEEKINEPINAMLLRNLLLVAGITGLAMAAARLIGNRAFIQPLRRLLSATASLARGNLQERSGLNDRHNEIGSLAREFDAMADSLQQMRSDLHRRELHLEEAQRIAHIGSWEYDAATGRGFLSRELHRILGNPSGQSRTATEHLVSHFRGENRQALQQAMEATLSSGIDFELQQQHQCPDGTIRWLSIRGECSGPRTVRGTVLDITASKQAEQEREALHEQLLHAQKLESIGRLAGGVAHDFNNMLGVIIGYTDLSLQQLPQNDPLRHNLREIETAAIRSSELVRQLLAFARRQTAQPRVLQLNEAIASMSAMLHRLLGADIELHWRPGDDLWPIFIDPGQVDQILANLCVNARDAMSGNGRITITTANVELADDDRSGPEIRPAGAYVKLRVHDTGSGIDEAIKHQIFDPFFTTKELGKGTGLGLSTVFGIIKQNNGFIDVASSPGQGTTFTILFPRFQQEHQPPPGR